MIKHKLTLVDMHHAKDKYFRYRKRKRLLIISKKQALQFSELSVLTLSAEY